MKRSRNWLGVAAMIFFWVTVVAHGGDENALVALKNLSLEDLSNIKVETVVGASQHEQKTTDAPSSVTIITAEQIKAYGYRTLADILQSVRGFYVSYDGAYSFIGVRGFNRPSDFGGRVLITLDGHRINEPIYDQAFNGTEGPVDVDLIDRVEIIRGPGSSLYGNNAFFAVVNIITKRGRDFNGAEVAGSYGSFNSYSGRFSYGNKFTNGLETLVSGTYFSSEGRKNIFFPEYSAINGGNAQNLDGQQGGTLFVSASYRDFSVEGGLMERAKDVPSAAYGSVFDQPENINDQRAFADLKFQHLYEDGLHLTARLYYDHYRYDGAYTFQHDTNSPVLTQNRDFNHAESLGGEVQLQKNLWERHRLTFGVDYQRDLDITLRNVDLSPALTYMDTRHGSDTVGIYLQDEFSILTNLVLNLGGRYDYFSTFGNTANPRAALIWQPQPGTTLKGIYGQAYHAPNANELYYTAGIYELNPQLRPETIQSYEAIWEQTLGLHLRSTADVYYNQIRNFITQQFDPATQLYYFGNTDSVDSYGLGAELEGRWGRGWQSRVSYTLQRTANKDTGQSLPNSPTHLAKFSLLAPLVPERLFAGVEIQGMSGRTTEHGTSVGGFWTVNTTLLSRELVKGLEVSASVYNLFDQKYSDPVSADYVQNSMPQAGRTFRLKLTYRF